MATEKLPGGAIDAYADDNQLVRLLVIAFLKRRKASHGVRLNASVDKEAHLKRLDEGDILVFSGAGVSWYGAE